MAMSEERRAELTGIAHKAMLVNRVDKSEFACMECSKKFRSVQAAERAARNGCPKCGGVDIDLN